MLDDPAKREILAAVSSMGTGGPITIVVASSGYAQFLDNWLCHMHALSANRFLIIAMDNELWERFKSTDIPLARADFDGTAKDFWLQRALIWECLSNEGVEFIHSDVDAVWLRDPVPLHAGDTFDLLISQGTRLPRPVLAVWGFVLCTGFFWARPTPATRRLFHALVTPPEAILNTNDQAVLNNLLAAQGTSWQTDGIETYALKFGDSSFTCFRAPVAGYCANLDLHLTLLPHHLYPRLQPCTPGAIVRHVMRTPAEEQRIDAMRAAGCWLLDAYPDGFLVSR